MDITLTNAHDDFAFTAYRADAKGARRGGVVVIQEIFGVTDHIRAICDFFADAGYDAIAPSLYDRVERGFLTSMDEAGIQTARAAIAKTPLDQVAGDIQACIDALAGPVFITGFCYGGAMSWLAAARCTGLSAASGFYGRMINDLIDEAPNIPIILHYGRKDPSIPMSAVDQVRAAYPAIPIHLYDAGHGFCREGSADFHAESRDIALKRTLEHFAAHA